MTKQELAQVIAQLKAEIEFWQKQAIVREEHIEFYRKSAKFYRKNWNEALLCLPKEKREKLLEEDPQ